MFRYSLKSRQSKVNIKNFANPKSKNFFDSLPKFLKAEELKKLIQAIKKAKKNKKQIVWMLGGHTIKCGLSPIFIELMQKGFITHLAMNGSVPIHDFEIAFIGSTSEDVDEAIKNGTFGMAKETGQIMNQAITKGLRKKQGYGLILGKLITESKYPYKNLSILYSAYKLNIPATVHTAIGAEIIYQHPEANGAALGQASFSDFKKFTKSIEKLENGVVLNLGSAVIMPEVFLKALSISRNQSKENKPKNFTAANFDMISHYRPLTNILKRPGAKAYDFRGHHEIMIPLLAQALL